MSQTRWPRRVTIPRVRDSRLSNSWSQIQTDNNMIQAAGAERTLNVLGINGITTSGIEGNPDTLIISGGDFTDIAVDSIQFTLTGVHTHEEGKLHWDEDNKTLHMDTEVAGVGLEIGQEMFLRVTNKTGSTITKGQLTYVSGAQGSRPTITLAKGDTALNASTTIGMAGHDIAHNDTGYITTFGYVRDIDTSATTAGDKIYLSSATAGAFTNVAPAPPDHAVQVGYSLFSNPSSGIVLISIDTGNDLTELHDVLISGVNNNDILQWDSATSLWKNGPAAGGDHGGLTGLADDDHTQYVLADGTRDINGTQAVLSGISVGTTDLTTHSGITGRMVLKGPAFNNESPVIQFLTDQDNYPGMFFGILGHGAIGWALDSYFDLAAGNWKASTSSTGSFGMSVNDYNLYWWTASGVAGSAITPKTVFSMDALNGYVGIGDIDHLSPFDAVSTLHVVNTHSQEAVIIDQSSNNQPTIDFQGNTGANATATISTITNSGNIQGYIQIEINGTQRWLPFYDDPA